MDYAGVVAQRKFVRNKVANHSFTLHSVQFEYTNGVYLCNVGKVTPGSVFGLQAFTENQPALYCDAIKRPPAGKQSQMSQYGQVKKDIQPVWVSIDYRAFQQLTKRVKYKRSQNKIMFLQGIPCLQEAWHHHLTRLGTALKV